MDRGGEGVKPLVLEYAKSFYGVLYRWGGASPKGIDCSGLVVELLISGGVLPNGFDTTAQGLYGKYAKEWPVLLYPVPGAVNFYGKSLERISHVSFCMDNSLCIEAGGGDSETRTPEDAALKGAFVRLRPIKYRKDYLLTLMPQYPVDK